MISGVVLMTPYYRLFTERLYDAYKYLIPLTAIKPNHKFECEYGEMTPEYYAKFKECIDDPRGLNFFTAQLARIWVEEQEKARTSVQQA